LRNALPHYSAGIGLKSLEVDNFQTVYAAGVGPSKDLVQEMLASLKNEKLTVLPPPYSLSSPTAMKAFASPFLQTEFGLNLDRPARRLGACRGRPREGLLGVLNPFKGREAKPDRHK